MVNVSHVSVPASSQRKVPRGPDLSPEEQIAFDSLLGITGWQALTGVMCNTPNPSEKDFRRIQRDFMS